MGEMRYDTEVFTDIYRFQAGVLCLKIKER